MSRALAWDACALWLLALVTAACAATPLLLAVPVGCEPAMEVVAFDEAAGSVFRYVFVCPPGWAPGEERP